MTQEIEKKTEECLNETYLHKIAANLAQGKAESLFREKKRIKAKLKQEREQKRKTQEDVWIKNYETCIIRRENREADNRRKMKEAMKAAKAEKAAKASKAKKHNS